MSILGESSLVLLVLVFGLLLRLPQSLSSGSDQWGVYVKIRKHAGQRWLRYDMPDSVIPGIFPYPMLVHYLISRFPERHWKTICLLINQGADILTAVPVYLLLRSLLAATAQTNGGAIHAALAGTLLYLTTPILFPVTSRLKSTNGRCFGMMLSTAYFLLLYPAMFQGSYAAGAACVALAVLTYLSSFFAMQTVIFYSVGLAARYLNWMPLAVIALSLVLSFAFPGLGTRDTLIFKVNHFICYAHNAHKNTTATGRNLFLNAFRFFAVFGRDRTEAFTLFFRTSPLLIGLYSFPSFWFLAGLWGLDAGAREALAGPLPQYCGAVVLLSFLTFVATSISPLVIFGQAERYFEYGAPFLAVCVTLALVGSGADPSTSFLLVCGQIAIILFVDLAYNKRFFRELRQGDISGDALDRDLVERLRALGQPLRIATVPIKLPILLSAFAEDSDPIHYYYRFIMRDRRIDGFKDFTNDIEDLNIFVGTPQDLARKYGMTHVLCQRKYLNRNGFRFLEEMRRLPVVLENERYVLFEIAPEAGSTETAPQGPIREESLPGMVEGAWTRQ